MEKEQIEETCGQGRLIPVKTCCNKRMVRGKFFVPKRGSIESHWQTVLVCRVCGKQEKAPSPSKTI